MRIVSANLQHGLPNPLGRPDIAHVVPPLRERDADVYAFQELDRRRWRSRGSDQAAYLADFLDGELLRVEAKRWLWSSQNNALVVRGELVERTALPLPGPGERRVAAVAQVVVGGQRWSVATTHLSLDTGTAVLQLESVLETLAERPAPRVLMGDLNLQPERVAPVAAATGWDLLDGPPTVNARTHPDRRLDHILIQGAEAVDSGVQKLPVSDHLAVWADLATT